MNELVPATSNEAYVPINVDNAVKEWEAYQELCTRILNESDYQTYVKGKETKKFKKNSAWQKLARAFNVTTEPIETEEIKNKVNKLVEVKYRVKATLPNGRYVICDGRCNRSESGKEYASNHTISATAETRATNRAISRLIGAGEVSDEELDDEFLPVGEKVEFDNSEDLVENVVQEEYIEPEFTTAEDVKPVKLDPVLLKYCKTLRNKLIEKCIPVSQSSMKDQLFLCIKAKEIDEVYKIPLIEFIYSHCPEELLK